jgi:hypothetical protein
MSTKFSLYEFCSNFVFIGKRIFTILKNEIVKHQKKPSQGRL